MSNYGNTYKNLSEEVYSPVDFKKSSVKSPLYTSSAKDPEIEDLKNKYGINSTRNIDKYSDSYRKFDHIKKVSEEISDLRATYNPGSKTKTQNLDKYDKWDKYDNDDFINKNTLSRAASKQDDKKPTLELRHTVYSKKTGSSGYDYSQPSSSDAPSFNPYRKNSNQEDYKYDIKVQSPKDKSPLRDVQKDKETERKEPKIDFDKINEKLKNNAAMIDELRRLKEERKMRYENKLPKSENR